MLEPIEAVAGMHAGGSAHPNGKRFTFILALLFECTRASQMGINYTLICTHTIQSEYEYCLEYQINNYTSWTNSIKK